MLTVRYFAIDGARINRQFKSLKGARTFAAKYVGENPDFGGNYAVSSDGIGKITVKGCTIRELFAAPAAAPASYPFQVWYSVINEDAGTSSLVMAKAFTTLQAAADYADEIEPYSDGVQVKAATPEAEDEIYQMMQAIEAKAFNAEQF